MPNPKTWGDPNIKGPVYVGIDQSYSGFAMTAINDTDEYYTEVWKLEDSGVKRLAHAQQIVSKFLSKFKVNAVSIENYAFGSQKANTLGELGGAVKLALFYYFDNPECAIPLVVSPPSLKKYITGKGRVEKSQILLAVYKKWDVEFTDDNAADSYGLARIVRNKHDFEYEKEVYDKLISPGK